MPAMAFFNRICGSFILAALVLCSAGFAHALEIRDVRFGLYHDKTRLVLDVDRATEFRAFTLGNPYRLILDLPDFVWQAGDAARHSGAGVSAVRHGRLEPGISRVVFDMNRPVSIRSAFVLPGEGSGGGGRLVVDFSNVSDSLFRQTVNTVHGRFSGGTNNEAAPEEKMTASLAVPRAVLPQGSQAEPEPKKESYERPLIIIDPGHGGVDPGASGAGLHEKNVVLGLAKALKEELEASGLYRVAMTREADVFIKLGDRVKFARERGGDLFISIHADSLRNPNVGGASVYTLSKTASDEQTEKLAARENKADLIAGIDLSVEDEEVANILVDLAMRDTMNQSNFFAGKLVTTLPRDGVKLLERPHRSAGFAVLKAPDIPSVLIEAGFMSNEKEARRLNSPEHRRKFARSLRRGVDAYFEQIRKNQKT